MRVDLTTGAAIRGSQKWLQIFVDATPENVQPADLATLEWRSPLRRDSFREYQDGAFLDVLGRSDLRDALAAFWPRGGPVWDGLALADGAPVLVEAKAHIGEFLTTPCSAKSRLSRNRIRDALNACRSALRADDRSDWMRTYYQYANRLAHLWWLHERGVRANLLFLHFIGDTEMQGPRCQETWKAAQRSADYALGLPTRHPLTNFVHHVYPDVRMLRTSIE
ncbi:hypothetical protein NHN26_13585 [Rhodovulum tesquicola]|uniref:hypothetical protein n=1 Tax=Rhodovulum tesquicola TaxID=540254 RepID=UPI0020970446|nr:hypothetical protein [Rhodovulum tesquicola]MCO8146254.1 hypothetical protein [Rhodovulum tesquicola]